MVTATFAEEDNSIMSNTRQTPRRLRRLFPWVIVMILTVVMAYMALGIWVSFLSPARRGMYAGYPAAFRSVIHELFVRDFEQDPTALHLLDIGTGIEIPVTGLVVRGIYLKPVYDQKWKASYEQRMWDGVSLYNYVTLGQACYLALQGEDSNRVRYVLKVAERFYAGSFESKLLSRLDDLYEGDESAKELFARVQAYGLGRIERLIPPEKLIGRLEVLGEAARVKSEENGEIP